MTQCRVWPVTRRAYLADENVSGHDGLGDAGGVVPYIAGLVLIDQLGGLRRHLDQLGTDLVEQRLQRFLLRGEEGLAEAGDGVCACATVIESKVAKSRLAEIGRSASESMPIRRLRGKVSAARLAERVTLQHGRRSKRYSIEFGKHVLRFLQLSQRRVIAGRAEFGP